MRAGSRALLLAAAALCGCHHAAVRPDGPETAGVGPSPVPIVRAYDEPTLNGVYHPVRPGETLYRIARAYGTTPEALAQANAISNARDLTVGMKLFIPGASREVPLPEPALDGAVVDAASAGDPTPRHAPGCVGPKCLDWPLRGVIYARFGPRAGEQANGQHEGLDLAAPEGTPIAAAAAGQVLYAGEQQGYGTLVILQHPDGLVTLYAHNRENLVRDGQHVAQGQIIARVGQSGRTSGPHCHFEVRRGEAPIDPLVLLPSPSSQLPSSSVR
jgi:murein DD-endopeptidase MepM/ murein hydrolase activator NlpD